MVSNGLSNRRGPLRRPKVCLTHKNPGRCEPPPPPGDIVCSVILDSEDPVEVGDDATLIWGACNPVYDDTLVLLPSLSADIGEITQINSGENCIEGHNAEYQAPEDPGEETITMDVEWPDGSECQSVLSFPVVPEEE